ncbi:hypothetical protein [Streptomyces sp. P3]|uniref:hypothetical protein n=1 Tax=Streptomyces sp. P3 TaxID=2135430 RepID=UPI0020B14F37|nr:hypothetical protein [Streptomyces sp. P3]
MPPAFVHHGVEAPVEGHGLDGLFPPDLTGYHDGAEVSLPIALELVRAMLRAQGAWCRVELEDWFTVHVGWDQYVYVGSDQPCADAVARTRELGLFPEPLTASPYAAEADEAEVTEPADEHFWARVNAALASRHALLLEEGYVRNASRWHRITPERRRPRGSRRTRRSPACRRTRRNRRRTTLDALLIRMVVVPALMHLCGRANWWLPRRLDKALPNVSLEGPGDAPAITSPPVREPQPAGRAG